jgi:hypothetical protein
MRRRISRIAGAIFVTPLKEFTGGESGKSLSQRKLSCLDRRTLHPSSKPFHMKDALRCSPAEPH